MLAQGAKYQKRAISRNALITCCFVLIGGFRCHHIPTGLAKNVNFFIFQFLPSAKPHGQHVVFQVRMRRRTRRREGYFKKIILHNYNFWFPGIRDSVWSTCGVSGKDEEEDEEEGGIFQENHPQ